MTKQQRFFAKAATAANFTLAGGGTLLLLVFFFFFYHYTWAGQRQFTSPTGIVLYYVMPILLASLLFASLKLNPTRKINLVILCFSLLASMYAGELLLHLTSSAFSRDTRPFMFRLRDWDDKQSEATKLAKQYGVEIDTREGLEVVSDLRKQGVDAVPFISSANDLFVKQPDGSIKSAININGDESIPLGAISNKVTVLCNENGQWVTYLADEHGFNNPNGIWDSAHVEIAALGDSFTQGYCVPTDKSYIGLIRQPYPATVNLGIAGEGPLLMLVTVKEYLPFFKPKIVLWFYYEGNDLTDLQDEKKSRLLMSYLKEDFTQNLLARQNDIDQALVRDIARLETIERKTRDIRLANRHMIIPKLLDFMKLPALRQRLHLVQGAEAQELEALSDVQGPNMEVFRDILSQAKARVSAWGGTLYVVYLPSWTSYFYTPEIGVKERERVLTLIGGLDIPIIDIYPAFQTQTDLRSLFPFGEVGHYNEKGHKIVAEEVLKVISSSIHAGS